MPKEMKFGYGFLLAGAGVPYLLDKLLPPVAALIAAAVLTLLGFGFLVSGHRQAGGTLRRSRMANIGMFTIIGALGGGALGALSAAIYNVAEPHPSPLSGAHPVTLKDLFDSDWPSLAGYYTDGIIEVRSAAGNEKVLSVGLSWRLNADFVSRSTFLAIYLDQTTPPTDALNACLAIAESYSRLIDNANGRVDISGQSPGDSAVTHLKDMVFSKRIFIYYANPDFSVAQKGLIETAYQKKDLAVQFRDSTYAWVHRADHSPLRTTPLVPNTVILPDPHLYPGLVIQVKKLGD